MMHSVQHKDKISDVRVSTPNRYCLTCSEVINHNDVTSATNSYVFDTLILNTYWSTLVSLTWISS